MATLRARLELNLAQNTVPALRDYATELGALEKQAASARDYDTAAAVRKERLQVLAEAASQEKLALLLETRQPGLDPSAASEKIVLKIADAQLDGGVALDAVSGALTGWSHAGASATWKLPDLPAGGYEVVLRYASGPMEGGTVLVQETFFTLTSNINTTLKGPEEQNLGTLKIRDGSGTFKISAKTVLHDNLMQLLGVELLPANR